MGLRAGGVVFHPGFRRIYPDLPGMGRTVVPDGLRSAEDVLGALLAFARPVTDGTDHFLIGHSAGAYYAQAMAARGSGQVAGLALVCPLLEAGSTLVLYTDGLVEQRRAPIDQGLTGLVAVLTGAHRLDVEQLSDLVLGSAASQEDDIALLVLRA